MTRGEMIEVLTALTLSYRWTSDDRVLCVAWLVEAFARPSAWGRA